MINERSLVRSFGYAFEGVFYGLKYNRNLRIHFLVALAVIVLSLYFKISVFEMGIVGILILLVISSEMINTALEEMVNLIVSEHRKEAKIAKDAAAGMVLVTSLGSVIIGSVIFVPHILKLL